MHKKSLLYFPHQYVCAALLNVSFHLCVNQQQQGQQISFQIKCNVMHCKAAPLQLLLFVQAFPLRLLDSSFNDHFFLLLSFNEPYTGWYEN